jgi:maltose alpha-D-glucosyltransferase / alpha-amylase
MAPAPQRPLRASSWGALFAGPDNVRILEKSELAAWLRRTRWFGGKAYTIESCRIDDRVYLPAGEFGAWMGIIRVSYRGRHAENYAVMLGWCPDQEADCLPEATRVTPAVVDGVPGYIVDGLHLASVRDALFHYLLEAREFALGDLVVRFLPGRSLAHDHEALPSKVLNAEQSNSSVVYGDRYVAKMYRKVEYGINPDLEVTRYLTEQAGFAHIPAFRGAVEMLGPEGKTLVLAMFQDWVHNQGDAWSLTLRYLREYYLAVRSKGLEGAEVPVYPEHPDAELPPPYDELIGAAYYAQVDKLAARTAGMHRAMASGKEGGAFTAELQDEGQVEAFSQATHELTRSRFEMLRNLLDILRDEIRQEAEELLSVESEVDRIFTALARDPAPGKLIRIHGDYHLGQVLFTGEDFVVLDFEGEPDKPHSERRRKYSPLKDVAGMVRSFHYAVHAALLQVPEAEGGPGELAPWAMAWYRIIANRFLDQYLAGMLGTELLPADRAATMRLLRAFILEKAVYELGYELNNRPEWVAIPLQGIRHIVKSYASS